MSPAWIGCYLPSTLPSFLFCGLLWFVFLFQWIRFLKKFVLILVMLKTLVWLRQWVTKRALYNLYLSWFKHVGLSLGLSRVWLLNVFQTLFHRVWFCSWPVTTIHAIPQLASRSSGEKLWSFVVKYSMRRFVRAEFCSLLLYQKKSFKRFRHRLPSVTETASNVFSFTSNRDY